MKNLAVIGVALLGGCVAHLTGTAQVDGAPFVAHSCRAGVAYGYCGVEIADKNGRLVRLVCDPLTNDVKVGLVPSAKSKGVNLGSCGTLEQSQQISVISGVRNQQGTATFDCHDGAHSASGTIGFAFCH